MQLINAIPPNWKTIIKHNCSNANLLLLNHHLIKKNNSISLDKLHCRELYNILVYTSPHKQPLKYILRIFFTSKKKIYVLPRKVSLDCNVRSFQYKVLNNRQIFHEFLLKIRNYLTEVINITEGE